MTVTCDFIHYRQANTKTIFNRSRPPPSKTQPTESFCWSYRSIRRCGWNLSQWLYSYAMWL